MAKTTRQMTFKLTALALACILISQPLGFAEYIKVDANQYQPVISAEDAEKRIQESAPSSPDTSLDFLNEVSPLSRPSVFHSIIQSDWWLNIALTLDKTNTSSRNFNAVFTGTQPDDTDLQISYAFNSLDPAAYTPWQTFSSNLQLELPDYEGVNYVNFKVKDSRGNEKLLWSSIRLDRTAPTASIILGDGTGSTSTKFVTLHTTASDNGSGLFEMSYSINSLEESAFSAWEAFNPDKPITLTPWQGDQYVNVRVRDRAGNTTFTWNKINYQAANPALILNSGAATTNSINLHVDMALGENFGAVTEMSYSVNSIEESAFTAWVPYANTADIQIPAYEGTNYITFRFRDGAGNSRWIWNTIKYDKTAPTASLLSPVLTNNASYTLSYTVSDNFDAPRTVTENVTLAVGNNTLTRTFADAAGNQASFTQVIQYIPVTYTGTDYKAEFVNYSWVTTSTATNVTGDDQSRSFTLPFSFHYFGQSYTSLQVSSNGMLQLGSCNNCTAYPSSTFPNTSSPNAVLAPLWRDLDARLGGSITYSSEPTRFVISWSGIRNYSSSHPAFQTFQVILSNDGSIVFQYATVTTGPTTTVGIENAAGTAGVKYNLHPANQTAIRFTPLTQWGAPFAINSNDSYTSNRDIAVTIGGSSPNGTIADMRFSFDAGATWTAWESFSNSKNLTLPAGDGTKQVHVQLRDSASFVSTLSDSIILDTTAPTGSITISSNAEFTLVPEVTLNLTGSDPGSGLDKMRFSTDAGQTWSNWENFSTQKNLTLPAGNGLKEVRYQLRNNAQLVSEFSDTITLDPLLRTLTSRQGVRKTMILGPLLDAGGALITYSFNAAQNLLSNGQFVLLQNQLTYIPSSGFVGSGSIMVQASSAAGTAPSNIVLNILAPVLDTPNDPLLSQQYALSKINAVRAWNLSQGTGVKVAVIDSGISLTHPDLAANIFTNTGEIAGDGIDNDNNGFIDDRNGWDFSHGDNTPIDTEGHGTHVAGIIGAVADNSTGGAGIAPESILVPIQVIAIEDMDAEIAFQNIARGILYAVQLGVKVINMSLGYYVNMLSTAVVNLLRQAINTARQAGIFVVVAAGNDAHDTVLEVPAAFEEVITVSSTSRFDIFSEFSNYGTSVDISAPGEDILSTVPASLGIGLYGDGSGTSMAAPLVSGLIAMMAAQDSALTEADVLRRLRYSSVDLGTAGYDTLYGYGRIDAFRALSYDYYDNGMIKTQWLEQADENGWTRLFFDQNGYLTGGI